MMREPRRGFQNKFLALKINSVSDRIAVPAGFSENPVGVAQPASRTHFCISILANIK